MRRRVQQVAVVAALIAVVVFGLPLAVAVRQVYVDDERRELTRIAERAASAVSADALRGQDPVELPAPEPGTTVGIYTAAGTRMDGRGPARADVPTRRALGGSAVDASTGGELVAAVPVREGERIVGAVRAAAPARGALVRAAWTWAAMAGLAVLAVGAAALVARRQSGRLARPLVALAAAARELGDGDFTVRAPRAGVPEIDTAAAALDDTAVRLGGLLERERAFSANASHQLRTPLTGLRLILESASGGGEAELRDAAARAIDAADRLERTIDELLALSRAGSSSTRPLDVDALLADVRDTWVAQLGAAGRALRTTRDPDLPAARASGAAVRQILAVLVDNATVHGRGAVTVRARDAGDALAFDVEDEGPGPAPDADLFPRDPREGNRPGGGNGHGLGLPLARALAEAEGGRLVLARGPRFTLVLPRPPRRS
ncbi:MAG TPA: HAMP domain-containing sensor histidine kinase [Mycobacteriales bacterium]